MWAVRERGIQNRSKVLGLSSGGRRLLWTEMGKTVGEANLRGKIKSFFIGYLI